MLDVSEKEEGVGPLKTRIGLEPVYTSPLADDTVTAPWGPVNRY